MGDAPRPAYCFSHSLDRCTGRRAPVIVQAPLRRYGHAEGESERLVKELDDEASTL
jgi:hypothetical protein